MEEAPGDETLAGPLAEVEVPDNGEELKASDEAITFMSCIGEFIFFPLV